MVTAGLMVWVYAWPRNYRCSIHSRTAPGEVSTLESKKLYSVFLDLENAFDKSAARGAAVANEKAGS